MDGKVHVYRREGSRRWQCAVFLGGRNHRTTTGQDNLAVALEFAREWYMERYADERLKRRRFPLPSEAELSETTRGSRPRKPKDEGVTFKAAAEVFLAEYQVITLGERNARYVAQKKRHIELHLTPFFGGCSLSEVTAGRIQEYRVHRVTSRSDPATGLAKRPARSTLHHEIVTLRRILKTANRKGWISAVPDMSAPYKASGKIGHRAWFSPEEYKRLYEATRERARRGLYDKPSTNAPTGKPTPPLARAVVDAVARRDNARLLVDGMTAANDLGLTTAVPAQVTVFTDARLRPIQLGAQQIRFKQAAPSRLYWAGHPAMRVVQALYWMQDLLPSDGPDVLRKLRKMIVHAPDGPAIAFDLQTGLPTLPTWMQTRARDLLATVGFPDLHPRPDPVDDHDRMAPITGPAGAAG